MKLGFLLATAGLALSGVAAANAQVCAMDQPGWTSNEIASQFRGDVVDVMLVQIGVTQDGAFEIQSARWPNGNADPMGQLGAMAKDLRPHRVANRARSEAPATPFDAVLARDTLIVFDLEPSAWRFSDDPATALFLKPLRANGQDQSYDPFSDVAITNNGRRMAVRFNTSDALMGCGWDYNLGVSIKQSGMVTPVIIDPKIENGGVGQR